MIHLGGGKFQVEWTDEKEVRSIFTNCGLAVIEMWRLENRYWPEAYADMIKANPWWLVKTPYGLIEIGPRKRVTHIEWTHTRVRKVITEDDTTKGPTMVHSWSFDKTFEYLRQLEAELAKTMDVL